MIKDPALAFLNIVLGTLVGALISIPVTFVENLPLPKSAVITVGIVLGFTIALRRRYSRAFFYQCLISAILLSSLILSSSR